MFDIVGEGALFVRAHLTDICTAVAASLLMIFGTPLAKWVARKTRRRPRFVRVAAFVLLSSVGMALLMGTTTGLLSDLLTGLSDAQLLLVIGLYFLGLSWFASREGFA